MDAIDVASRWFPNGEGGGWPRVDGPSRDLTLGIGARLPKARNELHRMLSARVPVVGVKEVGHGKSNPAYQEPPARFLRTMRPAPCDIQTFPRA
jgi:hypothetical protein